MITDDVKRSIMKMQRLNILIAFLISFLAVVVIAQKTPEEKKEDIAKIEKQAGIQQLANIVRTEDVTCKSSELLTVWNKKHPDHKIEAVASETDVKFKDLAVIYGDDLTPSHIVDAYTRRAGEENHKLKNEQAALEQKIADPKDTNPSGPNLNLYLGYFGTLPIYFRFEQKKDVNEALGKVFPKIYGLKDIDADKADFTQAIETVFGKEKDILFDKIEIDSTKNNLDNFKNHLAHISQDPIPDSEKDPRLVLLRKAITDYNNKKDKDTLKKVKEEWLNQLKGDAMFPSGGIPFWLIGLIMFLIISAIIAIICAILRHKKNSADYQEY